MSECNIEITPKSHLIQALKAIVKVSALPRVQEELITYAKFCFCQEPKMKVTRFFVDGEYTDCGLQMSIAISLDDFEQHTKAPKHGTWIRLSELGADETARFIVGSGASCWVNVLAVRIDDEEELNTEDLRLQCISNIYNLYIGQLEKNQLVNLEGTLGCSRFNNMKIQKDSEEAKRWYICPIAEDVE